jgi:RNA polymerase sigma-70 factor (ECF subfamily)
MIMAAIRTRARRGFVARSLSHYVKFNRQYIMDDREWLAHKFEERRRRLKAVAYRMLGSLDEADDAVQEAWLRLSRSDAHALENLDGWLTTVIGRVCLDMLRSRQSRREEALDEASPDLILSRDDGTDPESEALIADAVGIALLVVLETLAPPERLAFVLHDTFGVPFSEIAGIVGCSVVAARQFASRARRRVQGARTPNVDVRQQRTVISAFFAAVRDGNFDDLLAVLDPDIIVRADDGPTRELRGARAAAEGALLFSRAAQSVQPILINGVAGIASWLPDGRPLAVMRFTIRDTRITEIDVIRAPGRLAKLDLNRLRERRTVRPIRSEEVC